MTEAVSSGDSGDVPRSEDLELQLSELEMLRSMFPEEGELALDDPGAEADVRSWLRDPDRACPALGLLSFRLAVSGADLHVSMGKDYPSLGPSQLDVYVRSAKASREAQLRLNEDLRAELETMGEGELAVGVAVQWLQEHHSKYVESSKEEAAEPASSVGCVAGRGNERFCRLWIYSHHIYSKTKRKNILSLADDFQLSGFSMPGKPGIVCLEGTSRNCAEVWSAIKSWNWKKINVKIQEETDVESAADLDGERRFDGFREIGFVKSTESRDYHMDMGEFYNYLKDHGSDYMFKEFFGLEKDKHKT